MRRNRLSQTPVTRGKYPGREGWRGQERHGEGATQPLQFSPVIYSPKELYAQENRALLKERAQEILEERGDRFPKGAARNMALAESWNDLTSADKNEWKERARSMTEDVSR